MENNNFTERRIHKRYKAPEKTLAITSDIIGQIIDISSGGCVIKFIERDNNQITAEKIMDILFNDQGFYAQKIPVKLAWQDKADVSDLSSIIIRKIGLQFNDITAAQKTQIEYFIKNYTVKEQ